MGYVVLCNGDPTQTETGPDGVERLVVHPTEVEALEAGLEATNAISEAVPRGEMDGDSDTWAVVEYVPAIHDAAWRATR